MGLVDSFKRAIGNIGNKRKLNKMINQSYGGDWQYFTWNYANQIYNIPEVRTAIEKIADIFSTIPIYHKVIDKKGFVTYVSDSIDRTLNYQPNPMQNSSQFIKNVVTQLLLESNSFVVPTWDITNGNLRKLYPIPNRNFEINLDDNNETAYVKFLDSINGNVLDKYDLSDIIYLSRFCTLSGGKQTNIGLYESVLESLGSQIVNVASPNKPRALLQGTQGGSGQLKDKDKKGAMTSAKASFDSSVYGIAYLDSYWNITPINWNENDVNQKLMQFIVNEVYNYFGINENIINNKASEIEMAMFVNTTIKPLAIQFEKEFTNKLFTENEYYYGNRIEFDYNPLLISTMTAKTSLAQSGLRNGFFNIDEVREQFGYSPLTNGLGQTYRTSADLVNLEVVDEYQLGKVDKSIENVNNNSEEIKKKEEQDGTNAQ